MRDVTPIIEARALSKKMRNLGILRNKLSESGLIKLAGQLSKLNEYDAIFDRSEKHFWGDVGEVLKEEADLNLSPFAAMYLNEVFQQLKFIRLEGNEVIINLTLQYYSHFSGSNRYDAESFFILLNPVMRYSHQISAESQISGRAELSLGPNVTGYSRGLYARQRYGGKIYLRYDYEIYDKLVASCSNEYVYRLENWSREINNADNRLILDLTYFIENKLGINANYSFLFDKTEYISGSRSKEFENSFSINLNYYFDRAFIFNEL